MASKEDRATSGTSGPATSTRSTLFGRLLAVAVVPTSCTVAVLVCFAFLLREPTTGLPPTDATFLLGATLILVAGVGAQVWAVRRLDRTVREPVEELVSAIDAGETPGPGFGRKTEWEIRLLHRRVERLLQAEASRTETLETLEAGVAAVTATLDRIASEESAGDCAACTGVLEPIGSSLRALIERMDRRETELAMLFAKLGASVGALGDEVAANASTREGSFMALVEAVSALRDTRLSVEAVIRELDPARFDGSEGAVSRVRAMSGRLIERVDAALEATGSVSSALKSEASRGRRLAERGGNLRIEVEGVKRRVDRPRETAGV